MILAIRGSKGVDNLMIGGSAALVANIRLGWKELPGTNNVAYCEL
jgi:hypothetical protein